MGRVGVLSPRGVATPGGGNAASIPERPDRCFSSVDSALVRVENCTGREYLPLISFSLAKSLELGKSFNASRLLGLFPRSIMAASLVARRMRSGKLVKLPLASASLTASIFRRGGRRT